MKQENLNITFKKPPMVAKNRQVVSPYKFNLELKVDFLNHKTIIYTSIRIKQLSYLSKTHISEWKTSKILIGTWKMWIKYLRINKSVTLWVFEVQIWNDYFSESEQISRE